MFCTSRTRFELVVIRLLRTMRLELIDLPVILEGESFIQLS